MRKEYVCEKILTFLPVSIVLTIFVISQFQVGNQYYAVQIQFLCFFLNTKSFIGDKALININSYKVCRYGLVFFQIYVFDSSGACSN